MFYRTKNGRGKFVQYMYTHRHKNQYTEAQERGLKRKVKRKVSVEHVCFLVLLHRAVLYFWLKWLTISFVMQHVTWCTLLSLPLPRAQEWCTFQALNLDRDWFTAMVLDDDETWWKSRVVGERSLNTDVRCFFHVSMGRNKGFR